MMWEEFERIAGYEVSYDDYHNVIEPMYNATNLSKQEFVKCLDSKRFSIQYKKAQLKKQLTKEMKELAQEMKDLCGHTTTYDIWEALRAKALEYIKEFPEYGTVHEFETAKGYSNCTYIKALVYYSERYGNEVKRVELVG